MPLLLLITRAAYSVGWSFFSSSSPRDRQVNRTLYDYQRANSLAKPVQQLTGNQKVTRSYPIHEAAVIFRTKCTKFSKEAMKQLTGK